LGLAGLRLETLDRLLAALGLRLHVEIDIEAPRPTA
jgi:hypothetical protein